MLGGAELYYAMFCCAGLCHVMHTLVLYGMACWTAVDRAKAATATWSPGQVLQSPSSRPLDFLLGNVIMHRVYPSCWRCLRV